MTVTALRVTALLIALATSPGICLAQGVQNTASGRFEPLDSNGDGVVSKLEYNSDALFSAIDSDRNNRISAQELQAILGNVGSPMSSAQERILYADSNSDGEIDDEELRRGIEARFRELDANKDGNVDLPELTLPVSLVLRHLPLGIACRAAACARPRLEDRRHVTLRRCGEERVASSRTRNEP